MNGQLHSISWKLQHIGRYMAWIKQLCRLSAGWAPHYAVGYCEVSISVRKGVCLLQILPDNLHGCLCMLLMCIHIVWLATSLWCAWSVSAPQFVFGTHTFIQQMCLETRVTFKLLHFNWNFRHAQKTTSCPFLNCNNHSQRLAFSSEVQLVCFHCDKASILTGLLVLTDPLCLYCIHKFPGHTWSLQKVCQMNFVHWEWAVMHLLAISHSIMPCTVNRSFLSLCCNFINMVSGSAIPGLICLAEWSTLVIVSLSVV